MVMESITASGAMNVMYAALSAVRSLLTMYCLDGFSRKRLSSYSLRLARQATVSFMS